MSASDACVYRFRRRTVLTCSGSTVDPAFDCKSAQALTRAFRHVDGHENDMRARDGFDLYALVLLRNPHLLPRKFRT